MPQYIKYSVTLHSWIEMMQRCSQPYLQAQQLLFASIMTSNIVGDIMEHNMRENGILQWASC